MSKFEPPRTEDLRLLALYREELLYSEAEPAFDALTRAAALVCAMPIAIISIVDDKRQWFKSAVGLKQGDETPREQAFCAHAIKQPSEIFEVRNALEDSRFADNPLVTGAPFIRFYAGVPIKSHDGNPLGALCVINQKASFLSDAQRVALREIAAGVEALLLSRRIYREGSRRMTRFYEETPAMLFSLDATESILEVSNYWLEHFGFKRSAVLGKNVRELMSTQARKEYLRVREQMWAAGGWNKFPTQFLSSNGQTVDVQMSAIIEKDSKLQAIRVNCALTEVAQRHHQEPGGVGKTIGQTPVLPASTSARVLASTSV